MDNNDFNKFRELLVGLSQMYDKTVSQSLGQMYWNALQHLTLEQLQYAINAHVNDPDQGQYFPKPGNFTKHIMGTGKQQLLESTDRAELAWNVIMGEISRVGSWGTLKMDDGQALAAVKAIGGWKNLCSMSTDKLTWAKKEFLAAYGSYERTPVELLPNKLPGRIAIQNQKIERSKNGLGLKDVLENLNLKKDPGNGNN